MIVGIDDTDSKEGMCTTYLAAVLLGRLSGYAKVRGQPMLVRLNPNIEFKTRGNAAIALPLEADDEAAVKDTVIKTVEEMAVFSDDNTNPGIVFLDDSCTGRERAGLLGFAMRAVQDVLEISDAEQLIGQYGIDARGYKNSRGLIGALAAASFRKYGLSDSTYELIAYRMQDACGTPRDIDLQSVREADALTYPDTWDTLDIRNSRVVFAPHTPDPVLFGIRGKSPDAVRRMFSMIRSEPVERSVLYETNQGTDMHLLRAGIGDVRENRSYLLCGTVYDRPVTSTGGHVFFSIVENGRILKCASFEPTKQLRDVVRELKPGDRISVYGSLKNSILNLEKIELKGLVEFDVQNPLCCGRRMKSKGAGQGFRCEKCGAKKREKERVPLMRKLESGLYEAPPCARRHLAKPLVRMAGRVHPSR
ncbi:MAG TPA: DUF1743 domain-containing protein [Candidatus Methanoperedenaceae archaeon]|nr:DUF1743 domain-containing protein [Candidatus Methanoperedenaceae archaeon]